MMWWLLLIPAIYVIVAVVLWVVLMLLSCLWSMDTDEPWLVVTVGAVFWPYHVFQLLRELRRNR